MLTFTVLYNIVLGGLTAITALIQALTGAPNGSLILGGHLFFDTTNNTTPAVYVNTIASLQPTTAGLQFPTNGGESGVLLKDANGIVQEGIYNIPCTNTGGLAKYDTCLLANPLGKTGAIVALTMGCSTPMKSFVMSGSFVKAKNLSATATSFVGLGTKTYSTGSYVPANFAGATLSGNTNSGSILWNAADYIKFQADIIATNGSTQLNKCRGRVRFFDPNVR